MTEHLVTIDPGRRLFGMAYFRDGTFIEARGYDATEDNLNIPQCVFTGRLAAAEMGEIGGRRQDGDSRVLGIEKMETRRGRSDAHEALIQLSVMTGAAAGSYWPNKVEFIPPGRWTGCHDKPTHQDRTLDHLDEDETERINRAIKGSPTDTKSEIIDAVGIGLYMTGRYL